MLQGSRQPLLSHVCTPCWLRAHAVLRNSIRRSSFAAATGSQDKKFLRKRILELGGESEMPKHYPRWKIPPRHEVVDASSFLKHSEACGQHATRYQSGDRRTKVIYGRVNSHRRLGSRLSFVDLESGGTIVQVTFNIRRLADSGSDSITQTQFSEKLKSIHCGDWIALEGTPHTNQEGNAAVLAVSLPQTISTSLQPIPKGLTSKAFLSRNRHVERIVDSSATDPIVLRHLLNRTLRSFFDDRNFVEVNTPLLMASVGGATARPFSTRARELSHKDLNLRLAPELFLKRLVVGNMSRVYEIGPVFRNEGVDMNHNPEFTICEFYQAMADLESLIDTTEMMFRDFQGTTEKSRDRLKSVPDPASLRLGQPFKRVEFVTQLESVISAAIEDWQLPDLRSATAKEDLLSVAEKLDIAISQEDPSIPRILETLSSKLIESQIQDPTWLIHHPECMSPLAKSFTPLNSINPVAARAELFIRGQEYVNCYEEENSPLEQRRKFEEQLMARDPENPRAVDEDYLNALEWGMPPTGGWGCGLDRIVMLFSGRHRIADVLPFGTLSNVAAMGS